MERDIELTLIWGGVHCTVAGFADPFNTMRQVLALAEEGAGPEALALGLSDRFGHDVVREGDALRLRPGFEAEPERDTSHALRALIAAAAAAPEPAPDRPGAPGAATGGPGGSPPIAAPPDPSPIRPRRLRPGPNVAQRPPAPAASVAPSPVSGPGPAVRPRRVRRVADLPGAAAFRAFAAGIDPARPADLVEAALAFASREGGGPVTRAEVLARAAAGGDRAARADAARALADLVRSGRVAVTDDGRLTLGAAAETGGEG